MCTIVALLGLHPELPLIVGANRDEAIGRPASAPRWRGEGEGAFLCGLDERAGGTWMGATRRGFVVGLTNQRTLRFDERAPRSRGQVALEALRAGSSEAVRELLGRLDPSPLLPFNLIFGDAQGLHIAYIRRDPPSVELLALEPGIHVLTNDRIGSAEFPKAERARRLAEPLVALPWEELAPAFQALLADAELPEEGSFPLPAGGPLDPALLRRLQAICIHLPFYGTVSSTLLAAASGELRSYLYAEGRPCEAPFVQRSAL